MVSKGNIPNHRVFNGKRYTYRDYANSETGARSIVQTMKKSGAMKGSTLTKIQPHLGNDGAKRYLIWQKGKK